MRIFTMIYHWYKQNQCDSLSHNLLEDNKIKVLSKYSSVRLYCERCKDHLGQHRSNHIFWR